MTRRRGDRVSDDVARDDVVRGDTPLTRRTTPADRFADRLGRIKEAEQRRAGENRPTIAAPAPPIDNPEPTTPRAAQPDGASNKAEPAILDRMIGFFTGSQTTPSASKPDPPGPEAPEYRGAPSTRQQAEEQPAPEIENLEAFDQEDETKPVQSPGSLEPVFLNRLAGLFNDEEKAQSKGWKAEVRSDTPFPDRGKPGSAAAASPWTTTVEANVGDNRDPIVVHVAQTPVEEPNLAEPQPISGDPAAISRQASGKQTVMAKEPYGDPLRQPDTKTVETKQNAFFGRLTKLFQPKDPVALERESLLLEPDEKLATARDAMDGGVKVASRTEGEPKNYWPITSLTKADPQLTEPRRRRSLTRTSMTNVTLTLGDSVSLENTFPPGKDGTDPNNECVKKNRGTTLFCIEPIDWPVDLRPSFMIATILYTGSMAIVRYDQTVATRLHTLFRSEDFDKVTAYYQKRFGEPTEILKRSIAPLAKPRQDNPTVSWRSKDEATNAISVVEIRKFDDTRGGFPDTSRGTVMLYFTTSPSIFPQVSSHELMRLKRIGDITQTEADKTASEAEAGTALSAEPPAGGAAVSEDELFGNEPVTDTEAPSATDSMLDALPDNEPVSGDQLFERPQDAAPADQFFERPEDILSAPDLLTPEPDLLAPEVDSGEQRLLDSLLGEPVTDEPPDEIIEILPTTRAGGT